MIMVQLVRHDIVAWLHECAQQRLLLRQWRFQDLHHQLRVRVPYWQCLVALQDQIFSMFCGLVLIFLAAR